MHVISGAEIAAVARGFAGTPYHEDGRIPGIGLDCAGVVVCTLRKLGIDAPDVLGLSSAGDVYAMLVGLIEQLADPIADGSLQPGDLLVFRSRSIYNHMAIYLGDGEMIHAYNSPSVRRVAVQPLDDAWSRRVAVIYRYRGAK